MSARARVRACVCLRVLARGDMLATDAGPLYASLPLPCLQSMIAHASPKLPARFCPLQSAASDIIRGNDGYQLPPGLLTGGNRAGPPVHSPTAWPADETPLATGDAAACADAIADNTTSSGQAGALGTRGRALLGRLAGVRRKH